MSQVICHPRVHDTIVTVRRSLKHGFPVKLGAKFYIAYDGTGVPVVPRETEGRKGKQGPSKTREAKLGCIFTQTRVDAEGRPERDPESTS
jgi:hypothetical protein